MLVPEPNEQSATGSSKGHIILRLSQLNHARSSSKNLRRLNGGQVFFGGLAHQIIALLHCFPESLFSREVVLTLYLRQAILNIRLKFESQLLDREKKQLLGISLFEVCRP
jgi:hypothetical protein